MFAFVQNAHNNRGSNANLLSTSQLPVVWYKTTIVLTEFFLNIVTVILEWYTASCSLPIALLRVVVLRIRTVRMGSRVSVVEKRLDETTEHLLVVNQLRDKSGSHTAQIKNLNEMVKELCKLLGMEEKFNGIVHATKVCVSRQINGRFRQLMCAFGNEMLPRGADVEVPHRMARYST